MQNFDGSFSVANLKFKASSLANTINAETSSPSNYLISITFNTNNLNRSRLEIARTFIHELIHAEIFRKLMSCAGMPHVNFHNYSQAQFQQYMVTLKNNFPGLFDYYLRYAYETQNPSGFQHQQMAQHYRNIIAQALKQFDGNSQPESAYQALAWEGLMGTGPFNSATQLPEFPTVAWQNTPLNERIAIRNLITTYSSSQPSCQ